MNVYRFFTYAVPNTPFASGLLNDVTVIANNEEEAKKVLFEEYPDDFACDNDKIEIEVIGGVDKPMIVARGYYCDSY